MVMPRPWYGGMLLENPTPPKTQSVNMREPTDYEIRSARLQSQSFQVNSCGQTSSKRKREEHYVPPKTQSASMMEPTDYEIQSARLQSQSFQDNSCGQPSNKRKREEHYGPPPPPPSFNGNPPSDRLALSAPVRIPSLRKPVNSISTAPSSSSNSINNDKPPPALLILDADLWAQFHEQHNEMIITKSGRCLFPCLRFKILDLDPDSYYSMRIDFETLTPDRFRFYNGGWKPAEPLRHVDDNFSSGSHGSRGSTGHSTATTSGHLRKSYTHPDRWQLGSHWMADPISFAKVKLTNKVEPPPIVSKRSSKQRTNSTTSINNSNNGDPYAELTGINDINTNVFHMTSFHKYCPRIYLMQRAKGSHDIINSIVYRFDRTEFMAVTHYQNYKVNDLKKSHNPHAKGFRGTIGRVLPPVKFQAGQHYRGELDKLSSLANPASRPNKRGRSSWRSDESDFDDEMDGDFDPDREEADMMESEVMDSVGARTIGTRSGLNSAAVAVSMTRVPEGNTSPTCRLDKDNDALVTISLGNDSQEDAKVSERTTRQYFDQNAPLNRDTAVGIPGFHSRSTSSEATSMGQQFLPLEQNTPGGSLVRSSRHFNVINQQQQHANHHHHQHQHQQQPQRQSSLISSRGGGHNNKKGEQRSSPLQPLFLDRAPTVRMDRDPTHLSDSTRIALSMTRPPPPHISSMPNGNIIDDDDNNADLPRIDQCTPSISLGPLEDNLMSDQTPLQVPSAELECSALVVAESSTAPALNTAPAPPSLSWYQQFLWDQNTTNLTQDPAPAATSAASTTLADDVDGPGLPLAFQQLAAMNSATAAAKNSSTVGLAPCSTPNLHGVSSVQFPTRAFDYDYGYANGVVPTMSAFGSGTSTPSLAIACSSHSNLSSFTSGGRSGTDPRNMSGPYGYGPAGGSNNGSGGSSGSGGFHPDPRMSTSSVISILPVTGSTATAVEDPQKASIDRLVRENLRLKAFIRERYGVEAESEANAVVAMEYYQ
ncbi:T-box transcription factor tbx19 [Linnemannia hyalina]|uniref:T-box transcription factor tbx19 n=1 Tax=Linnemannia hyalina TaxID=64524 RepID=A0A9P7XPA5_9FUNG|nr:T-box transcription factor tbx19 [Linnemannia hyalina]